MGTLSAEQWGCQGCLLLSKSSSRAHWGAGILQSNRRLLLEPAGDVMQLVGKGGQPIRCVPGPVSAVGAAWQRRAERPRQRVCTALSGWGVAGQALMSEGSGPERLSSLFCNWSSSWREGWLVQTTHHSHELVSWARVSPWRARHWSSPKLA